MNTNTIADCERRKTEIRIQRATLVGEHKLKLEALDFEMKEAQMEIERQLVGLDSSIILHAEHVIYVRGLYKDAGEDRARCLEEAIQRILSGGGPMFQEYSGTKSYDRWHGQHSNHPYGMGPRHGYIIFQIGLISPIRQRETKALTEDEINACVYYLRNLEKIQDAEEKAKQVAKAS